MSHMDIQAKETYLGSILPTPKALATLLLLTCLSTNGESQQLLKPENQEVTLAGTIRLIHDYGPPGYGKDPKHDSHVSYWAIEVPVSVNLPCTGDFAGDCQPAKRINLFFLGDELKRIGERRAAKWKDKRVLVKGKLHRADTAGEMTPIYMDAVDISAPPEQN